MLPIITTAWTATPQEDSPPLKSRMNRQSDAVFADRPRPVDGPPVPDWLRAPGLWSFEPRWK